MLAGAVLLLVLLIALVTRGSGPALYWSGLPIANKGAVLSQGKQSMSLVVSSYEGTSSSGARCYFSVTAPHGHDVAPDLYCGPVRLPWSAQGRPWLRFPLATRGPGESHPSAGASVALREVAPSTAPSTVALPAGQELRRPDGSQPPASTALGAPRAPRQPAGWAATLSSPPEALNAAPVGDLMVAWGRSYRLVSYGQALYLPSKLAPGALKAAKVPAGSAWSTTSASGGRVAPLLLPANGQIFAVAVLAQSPGEMDSPVAAGAGSGQVPDSPVLQVAAATSTATIPVAKNSPGSSNGGLLTVAASVPAASDPVLQVVDKGLVQGVSLRNGSLWAGPAVLTRPATDVTLHASARLGRAQLELRSASLVWFAGSDGGTVPPRADQAYLEVLATTRPTSASLALSSADFSLRLPGGQVVAASSLPVQDRQVAVMGFVVPASFSYGTVVVSTGGKPLEVPVRFD